MHTRICESEIVTLMSNQTRTSSVTPGQNSPQRTASGGPLVCQALGNNHGNLGGLKLPHFSHLWRADAAPEMGDMQLTATDRWYAGSSHWAGGDPYAYNKKTHQIQWPPWPMYVLFFSANLCPFWYFLDYSLFQAKMISSLYVCIMKLEPLDITGIQTNDRSEAIQAKSQWQSLGWYVIKYLLRTRFWCSSEGCNCLKTWHKMNL